MKRNPGLFNAAYVQFLGYRILVMFILLWLSRLLFFIFNADYFSNPGFREAAGVLIRGLRFDLSALFMLMGVYILLLSFPGPFRNNKYYRTFAGFFYYLAGVTGLLVNFVDIIYFRFTQKRMTGDIFSYIAAEGNSYKLIPQFIADFWYMFLLFAIFVFVLVFLTKKVQFRSGVAAKNTFASLTFQTFVFILLGFISIIAIRGGFQLKPVNIITAGHYTIPQNVPFVLNTPFTILKTMNQKGLQRLSYFGDEELNSIFSPIHQPEQIQVLYSDGAFRNKNVVIIIMESLSSEHTGAFNKHISGYEGFTPFLDSLIGKSVALNGFANGKQSIEGIPSVVAGIPSLMDRPYIISPYAGNTITSLPSILNKKGYATAFYHGGTNGTMNFDGFARISGFQKYYGRTEYNNEADYDGNWGIFDEPYFGYVAGHLNNTAEPFFATIFSLSAHHPYKIPEQYRGKFRQGKLDIQQAVMYSDLALRQFFETVSGMDWYHNTIFVITADHTSESALPEYQTRVGMYRIPVIFFDPAGALPPPANQTAAQVDILPTLLSILNYDEKVFAFGRNLFSKKGPNFTVTYLNGIYQLISDGFVLEFDGTASTGLFKYDEDKMLKNDLLKANPDQAGQMETLLRAYLQQFNNRMIENRLTTDR